MLLEIFLVCVLHILARLYYMALDDQSPPLGWHDTAGGMGGHVLGTERRFRAYPVERQYAAQRP